MMLGIRTVVGNNPIGHSVLAASSSTAAISSPAPTQQQSQQQASLSAEQAAAARRSREYSSSMLHMQKLKFPGKGSSHTPAHAMRDFKFKDYGGEVFRKIRDRFKIDPTEYLLNVCGNFQYLEFISNSKSGQFCEWRHHTM
jgi:hypothetical protein